MGSPSSVGHAKKTGCLKSSLKPVFRSPLPMRGDASGDLAQHGQCSQMGERCQSPCLSSMVFPLQAVSGKKGDVQGVLHGFAAGVHASKIDRKSTRLNSSHLVISYAVFC